MNNWGLMVGPFQTNKGGTMWAEIEPAPKRNWRPLPGRMAMWWYEVHSEDPGDDCATTWAYMDRGSGGAFSFRKTVRLARDATHYFAYEYKDVEES
jgi:hypothetical protein